jgi:hypothetical protein
MILKGMWKETLVCVFKVQSQSLPGLTEKDHVKIQNGR